MGWLLAYSYPLAGVALVAATGALGARWLEPGLAALLALAVLAGVAFAWVLLRPGPAAPNPDKRLKKLLGSGRPVLVYVYSDFSLLALWHKPALAALERRWRGRVEFVHVSVCQRQGREVARRLGIRAHGAVLYDGRGREVCRGLPREADWQAAVARPAGP